MEAGMADNQVTGEILNLIICHLKPFEKKIS
jgi:hypothetical protein